MTLPTSTIIQDEYDALKITLAARDKEIKRLRAEVGEWRSAACINPERNWPHFEGWDTSQLARCFMKYVGGPKKDWADHVRAYAALQLEDGDK